MQWANHKMLIKIGYDVAYEVHVPTPMLLMLYVHPERVKDLRAPEQLVTASCPPSGHTLMGLVRHLTGVEPWFHEFDGEPDMECEMFEAEDGWEPEIEHLERDFACYALSVERARAAAAAHDLDDVVEQLHWVSDDQPKEARPTSLRWVYQHMIEEYARHNGHADLIRERIDGAVGD